MSTATKKTAAKLGYTALIEQGENGYFVAQCAQIPAAISQGKTIDEAQENLKEAILLVLEYQQEKILRQRQGQPYVRREIVFA